MELELEDIHTLRNLLQVVLYSLDTEDSARAILAIHEANAILRKYDQSSYIKLFKQRIA